MNREEVIAELKRDIELDNDFTEEYINAVNMAIQALEQQPCDDWHDVPSDEMTLEQARQAVKDLRKKLAEYLTQQLCQDAISREMALDCDMSIRLNKSVITQYPVGEYDYLSLRRACFHGIELAKHEMEGYLIDLPSVIPQPKMGRWIYVRYEGYCGNWHCSECRTIIPHMPEETDNTPIYKWCPMCGAKMQEESNG